MSATMETIDGRPALRFERRLGYPLERVWRAVTDPAELERWFVDSVDWTPALGETFEKYGESGKITELDPPNVIAWTFGPDRFRFELRAEGEGCLLAFTHVFGDRSLSAQHAAGWEAYFSRLDAHLAGEFLSELDAHENVAEWKARYVEEFGLEAEAERAR